MRNFVVKKKSCTRLEIVTVVLMKIQAIGEITLSVLVHRCQNSEEIAAFVFIAPIPVAALSKAWVYDRSLTGIAGSNPDGGMDICVLCMSCCQ
jgi:hypothetical protein